MRRAEDAMTKRLNHLNLGSNHQRQTGQSRRWVTWVESEGFDGLGSFDVSQRGGT